ncbi:MAG: peptide deformylase, partial [Marinilabiliales bacterium]
MIYPIVIYGSPILRKVAQEIDENYPNLEEFIFDMWETMYHSDGVGLAAPQVGKPIRLFVIDGSPFEEDDPKMKDFKKVFINARIVDRGEEDITMNEGCLSIPLLREDVERPMKIRLKYYDEHF